MTILQDKIKICQDIDAKIFANTRRVKIQQAIETKFEIIQSLQSTWLNRTLGKHRSNIKINKLIDIDEISGCKELLLAPDKIKLKVEKSFAHQFWKRNVKLDKLNSFWQEIYRPKGQFTQQLLLISLYKSGKLP